MVTRRERVVLELDDQFTGPMLRAAAAAEVLNRELNHLSGRGSGGSSFSRMSRDVSKVDRDVSNLGRTAQRTGNQIDTLSGRIGVLASVGAALGPGLIPIGAVGIPAISGLAAQFGFAAAGAGVMIGAFQGVGDALKATNKAAIEPTAANIEAANHAMAQISPAAQQFVGRLRELGPELKNLRDIGAQNMFPGLTEGLDGLESAMPRVQRIVGSISSTLGDIGADAGQSLGSDRWAPFLDFLADEAPAALQDMAAIAGNTAHAMAELWMAFDPLNDDFSSWMVQSTADLDRWAQGLSKTQGFADFVAYLESTGPQVAAALGAISNAFLQILEAAAPIGGPVLRILESVADAVAAIADSDLGTPILAGVAAWRAYALAAAAAGRAGRTTVGKAAKADVLGMRDALLNVTTAQQRATMSTTQLARAQQQRSAAIRSGMATIGKGAGAAAGLALASSGLADKIGLSNTASLALIGTLGGPWGAAVGGATGLVLDLAKAQGDVNDQFNLFYASINRGDISKATQQLDALKKRQKDINDATGFKDFFSDIKESSGTSLLGFLGDIEIGGINEAADSLGRLKLVSGVSASIKALSEGFYLTSAGAKTAAQSADEFSASIQGMFDRLASRGSMRDFEASIDDFRAGLKQAKAEAKAAGQDLVVGGKINIDTAAGRKVQSLMDDIGNKGLLVAQRMKNLGNDFGASRQLDKTRDAFVRAAVQAGILRRDARRLANTLINLDQLKPTPELKLGNFRGVMGQINAINANLDRAARDRQAKIIVSKVGPGASASGSLGLGPADGITVPGPRYPYRDKVPAILAPGEEVISNRYGQADRHRDLLKAINANRMADGGTVKALANGGTAGYAAGRGVTVYFPAPSLLSQAVKAAEDIAVSAANTARSAADTRAVHLNDLHLQQQIRDTQRDLAHHEDKVIKVRNKHGKGTHKKTIKGGGALTLSGLDRTTAAAELADLKAQLSATRALSDAAKEARDALTESRRGAIDSISGGLDLFSFGSAGRAARSADRYVADVAEAGTIVAQLRDKGASPLLLAQMAQHVQSGDAAGVVRLGRQFLAHPELLTSLTSSLSTLGSVSQSVATMTTDPRFLGTGAWNPANLAPSVAKQVLVQLQADPSTWAQMLKAQVTHEVTQALQGSDS